MRKPDKTKPVVARPGWSPVRLVQAIFSRQLRLKRGESGFRLVLENPASEYASSIGPTLSDDAMQALLMHSDLTALLDGAKGSRQVLRHLAAVEHDLEHKDPSGQFLFNTPAQRLKAALRQLDGLSSGSPPPGLAALRSIMRDAIKAQEGFEQQQKLRRPVSSFLDEHQVEVTQASALDFEQAHADWHAAPAPKPER
jgi:hypothetical protein